LIGTGTHGRPTLLIQSLPSGVDSVYDVHEHH
jgi:hypothetical protein